MLREWQVRTALGEAGLTVTINPAVIRQETRVTPLQRKKLRVMANPAIPGWIKRPWMRVLFETSDFAHDDHGITRADVASSEIFRRMEDVWRHRDAIERSQTYASIDETIAATGSFSHKRYAISSRAAIPDCIRACYLDILLSMAREGYVAGKRSDFATAGIGSALIDHDGSLLRCFGASHRMAAAIVVGVSGGFPLRIVGAHQAWLRGEGIEGPRDLERLRLAIRAVESRNAVRR
jgi:hypothetical protein